MAVLSLAGAPVLDGVLVLPRRGVWYADLRVDAESPPSGSVALASGDGGLSLTGTVRRAAGWIGSSRCRVVGGAGGLATLAAPKFYRSATVRIVLLDLVAQAGETLSGAADAGVLGAQLATWTTTAQPVGQVIAMLLDAAAPGIGWRLLPDGTVWCGAEAWPAADAAVSYEVLERHPTQGRIVVTSETVRLLPGQTLVTGEKLSLVEHHVSGQAIRTHLYTE